MNRSQRRALARGKGAAASAPADIPALMDEATLAYRQGQRGEAAALCKQILARAPEHPEALNILGILYQASGNHRLAAKTLAKAIARERSGRGLPLQHRDVVSSAWTSAPPPRRTSRKPSRLASAARMSNHFCCRIGIIGRYVAADHRATSAACRSRSTILFDADDIAAIADNIFLRCALETNIIRGVPLEFFLTGLRSALLQLAIGQCSRTPPRSQTTWLALFCALAQQCFLNEYVFAQTAEETQRANRLREVLLQRLSAGGEVARLFACRRRGLFPASCAGRSKIAACRAMAP